MIDLFVCTNEVNYAVALGALRHRRRFSLLVFDPERCDPRRAAWAWQMPLGLWSDRVVRILGRLHLLANAHVPHLRFRPRLLREAQRAPRLAYIDDGLDTLRRQPQNIDPPSVSSGQRPLYLTFDEYTQLPPWLDAFDVQRVCSLRDLASSNRRETIGLDGIDHLFVESPGLCVGELIAALGIDAARALCVRHPVPHKRGQLPAQCRTIEGRGHDLEATLLGARGKNLYFGSTMALVVALSTESARHNRIFVQLDGQQQANLMLPGRFEVVTTAGPRSPLRRAIVETGGNVG